VILCYIRRIDFEPKSDFLGFRTFAHVFLEDTLGGEPVDVYTDDPRFEAALLANYDPSSPTPPRLEVHWEEVKAGVGPKKVVQVIMDREFAPPP